MQKQKNKIWNRYYRSLLLTKFNIFVCFFLNELLFQLFLDLNVKGEKTRQKICPPLQKKRKHVTVIFFAQCTSIGVGKTHSQDLKQYHLLGLNRILFCRWEGCGGEVSRLNLMIARRVVLVCERSRFWTISKNRW